PAVLAVQALALGCPDREKTETGSENADTIASSESTTGEGPVDCAAMTVENVCEEHPRCAWYQEFGGCVIDCVGLDESDCNAVPHCEWYETFCEYEPVA
ncbi:MAG TPA: hypothetical protein VG755_31530, partial [Nannocystaceae bacterium]|nr:hypothetical protein [Nannocystaceae bacterium]